MHQSLLRFRKLRPIVLSGILPALLFGCVKAQRPEDLGELEKRVARLEREVRELQSARKSAAHAPLQDGKAANPRLETLIEKRRKLLQIYTEQHPAVRLLDQEIFDLEHMPLQR